VSLTTPRAEDRGVSRRTATLADSGLNYSELLFSSGIGTLALMKHKLLIGISLLSSGLIAGLMGCSASDHAAKVNQDEANSGKLTTGKVQSQISKGMSGGQVAEVLGSPNIVTTDEAGREVWVYDRFASEVRSSESSGGVWLVLGIVRGSSGAATKSTRSLTIVIKFDEAKKVRDVAYHSSSF
jgi:outer membrane protein assembly factor BamE (lipoprotein component of BamABCDE complex)